MNSSDVTGLGFSGFGRGSTLVIGIGSGWASHESENSRLGSGWAVGPY